MQAIGKYSTLFVRFMCLDWIGLSVATVRMRNRQGIVAAACLVACSGIMFAVPVAAQTVIYDGTQFLNFFSSSKLNDSLMLYNDPTNPDRNGVANSGADPDVLEVGDAAWFKSADRRLRNTNIGLASMAVGRDPNDPFLSHWFLSDGTFNASDKNGAGASYVLYDAGATTGRQTLNVSLYYNDVTPNDPDTNDGDGTGGNVAIRVFGVQAFDNNSDPDNPWDDDTFTHSAAAGSSGAWLAAGNHEDKGTNPGDPDVVPLLRLSSSSRHNPDVLLTPSDVWQDLSFQFDAGTGYDYLVFAFAGAAQDADTLGVDRYAFDNISFEVAPGLDGDFNDDGFVNVADYTVWRDNLGGDSAALNGNGSGGATVVAADYDLWKTNFGAPAVGSVSLLTAPVPEPSSVLLGATLAIVGLAARRRIASRTA